MSTTVHEDHPEWQDHESFHNPLKYFVPTLNLTGVTVKETHEQDRFGYVNKYIYNHANGSALIIMNSYGTVGFRNGEWESMATNMQTPEHIFEKGHLTHEQAEEILYKFIREELI